MPTIRTETELHTAILELEKQQKEEGKIVKAHLMAAYESIQPLNLIKSTLQGVIASSELKEQLLASGVGMAAGYLTRAIVVGKSDNPARKLLGMALMFGVTDLAAKNPDAIKSIGKGLWNFIQNTLTSDEESPEEVSGVNPEAAPEENPEAASEESPTEAPIEEPALLVT